MNSFRVVLLLIATFVGASSVAHAQLRPSMAIGGDRLPTDEEKKAAREREEAAKAALARIPAQQKATNDPWAGARDVAPMPAQGATNLVPAKKK
jgi:hypothetical protein